MITHPNQDEINALSCGDHGKPHDILGIHPTGSERVAVRAFRPTARLLHLVSVPTGSVKMNRLNEQGFFELTIESVDQDLDYHLRETTHEGQEIGPNILTVSLSP